MKENLLGRFITRFVRFVRTIYLSLVFKPSLILFIFPRYRFALPRQALFTFHFSFPLSPRLLVPLSKTVSLFRPQPQPQPYCITIFSVFIFCPE
jgi:hypothetical protein